VTVSRAYRRAIFRAAYYGFCALDALHSCARGAGAQGHARQTPRVGYIRLESGNPYPRSHTARIRGADCAAGRRALGRDSLKLGAERAT